MTDSSVPATREVTGKVLIVDPQEEVRIHLSQALRSRGIHALTAGCSQEARLFIEDPQIFLCFTDMSLPDAPGTELLREIKARKPDIAVVLVADQGRLPMAEAALQQGAYFFLARPLQIETALLLARRAWEVAELRRAYWRLEHSITRDQVINTMCSLAAAMDAKSPYTREHAERVACYSRRLARALGMDQEGVERVFAGALLHDVGKVGVPDYILNKPGRLTPQERQMVECHPRIGKQILAPIKAAAPFLPVVEYHHENWDGTGYPDGLKGEEIPLEARIVKVADTFDAITSKRPYRNGSLLDTMSLAILEEGRGTLFDPRITDCLLSLLRTEEPSLTT
jgi:putative two-component system response regulator